MSKTGSELARRFVARNFPEGAVIEFTRLYQLFGLEQPDPQGTYAEGEARRLTFMTALEHLRDALRREHKMDIENVRGQGYRIIPFHERVNCAVRDGRKGVRKELGRTVKRLHAIPTPEQLTGEDRRRMDHTLDLFGFISTMLRKKPI